MQSKLFQNPNFPSLYQFRKIWKFAQPRPTFENPNVEFMEDLGKLMS